LNQGLNSCSATQENKIINVGKFKSNNNKQKTTQNNTEKTKVAFLPIMWRIVIKKKANKQKRKTKQKLHCTEYSPTAAILNRL